ncbi:MAG: copper ion binding protein, partial [Methanolobus sp.]|nr:copper ion binding protein [Methanolobus sp.]
MKTKAIISIHGMTCMHCHKKVSEAISKLKGVEAVDVSLENKNASITFDDEVTGLNEIKQAVADAGYEVVEDIPVQSGVQPEETEVCPVVIDEDEKEIKQDAPSAGAVADITLKISGMTCASCAQNIETALKKQSGVVSATVNFPLEKASVTYVPTLVSPKELENVIVAIGYTVVKDKVTLDIGGTTCASCVRNIEKSLTKLNGVTSVAASLNTANVEYDPSLVSVKAMIAVIEDLGYTASVKGTTKEPEDIELKAREEETRKQRNNLIIAAALGIPISFGDMSNAFPNLLWFVPSFLADDRLLFILTTIVMLFPGRQFFTGTYR